MHKKNIPENLLEFLLLMFITILLTYRAPKVIASIWYLITLILYYRSRDEAFWMIFFFTTVDGFLGFLGPYEVTFQILAQLPGIEVVQIYIILTFLKAIQVKNQPHIFYKKYITLLMIYTIFLIIWGQLMGFTGRFNEYLRIIKVTIPLILFYSLPRLFTSYESYKRLFSFIFLVLLGAFGTQLIVLLTGSLPLKSTSLISEQISEVGEFRRFFNLRVTMSGLLGALFFLSDRNNKYFSRGYLYVLIIMAFGMAYISATRGLIISFTFIIAMAFFLTSGVGLKKIVEFSVIIFIAVLIGMSNKTIREQLIYASNRMEALNSILGGDVTAEGTLQRIDVRGPRVMKIFRENPIFGWGYSNTYQKYQDGHVGNQTLLMFSGITGFLLLSGFLLYFIMKLLKLYLILEKHHPFKSTIPIFIIFLLGLYLIHLTSAQQFNFIGLPARIIPQAIFISFSAFIFSRSKELNYG